MTARLIRLSALVAITVCEASLARAQGLVPNPTPEMYVENNQGGSKIVPNGQLSFDGQFFTCGKFPTVLDPLLNDYAAAPYKGFIILNPKLLPKVPTAVKLWIFHHECGHALGTCSFRHLQVNPRKLLKRIPCEIYAASPHHNNGGNRFLAGAHSF